MKKLLLLSLILTVFLSYSCKKDKTEDTESTLKFYTTVWNAHQGTTKSNNGLKNNIYTCNLIDIRHLIPKIEVTTDIIKTGVSASSINWTTIYTSETEMLHTERAVTANIPVGKYTGFKITQRNLMYWVCKHNNQVYEFPSLNNGNLGENDITVSHLTNFGFFIIDNNGNFELAYPQERLGTFEIKPNVTTKLTMRLNIKTIDWHDLDNSGNWSQGDELQNWTLPEGIFTMTDFIIEYE